jgi:glycosyltransferase involved in cell wall biosynthesis
MRDVSLQGDRRPRLLIAAYHYDRAYSMESRLSWQRAQHAAAEYDVTVITARPEIDAKRSASDRDVRVVLQPLNRLERSVTHVPGGFYVGYRMWHRRVLRLAKRLHAELPFDLVHHVSFCGYREPSDLWKLGVPFVWGPVGGTQSFPLRFLGQVSPSAALREVARNVVNEIQLRCGVRVQRAARTAVSVLAANRQVARDIERATGVAPLVQLETGVEIVPAAQSVRPRVGDAPLRILWAGRLQPWKGLPLLLKALAKLPAGASYELRVLGQGPCERRWRRLARRLGVDGLIQWCGWPDYAGQLPHYQWADVFAFTSLRDTSGTGLLEALSAGAPIVGLAHQGAADVMTSDCAVAVDASSPAKAIDGFRDAIADLMVNRARLRALSAGAVERAREHSWERQWNLMGAVYRRARKVAPAEHATPVNEKPESSPWPADCLVEAC